MIARDDERPKTILLKGDGMHEEGRASETGIYPGMLLALKAAPNADMPRTPEGLIKHATAGGDDKVRVAKEDLLSGRTINDAFALNDIIPYHDGKKGDVLFARVLHGVNYTAGMKLGSNGAGLFANSGTKRLVEAGEDHDHTATAAGTAFLRVVVL